MGNCCRYARHTRGPAPHGRRERRLHQQPSPLLIAADRNREEDLPNVHVRREARQRGSQVSTRARACLRRRNQRTETTRMMRTTKTGTARPTAARESITRRSMGALLGDRAHAVGRWEDTPGEGAGLPDASPERAVARAQQPAHDRRQRTAKRRGLGAAAFADRRGNVRERPAYRPSRRMDAQKSGQAPRRAG